MPGSRLSFEAMPPRLLVVALLLWPLVSSASSRPRLSLAELTRRSDRVVLAEVGGTEVFDRARLLLVTHLQVREELKGRGPSRVELLHLGQGPDGRTARVPGDAAYERGERAIMFLRCPDRANPDTCALFGLWQGKLNLVQRADGAQAVEWSSAPGRHETLTLEDVKRRVRAAVQERSR